jgi:hypothetical protein
MMMKCISREEGIELLEDIHKGVCGYTHHGAQSSRKCLGMDFTGPQQRMMQWKL